MSAVREIQDIHAQELMTGKPYFIDGQAFLKEAIAMMQKHQITALPIVDAQERPIGVLSQTDVVRHLYENPEYSLMEVDYFEEEFPEGGLMEFEIDESKDIRVIEVMTPLVFAVGPDAPASVLIEEMLNRKVHRLFVMDTEGRLAGVISTLDILKHVQQSCLKA